MARSATRRDTALVLTLLAGIASLMAAVAMTWPALDARARALAALELSRVERAAVERSVPPSEPEVVAAEVSDPAEPPRFLSLCKSLATQSGCTVASFDLAEASQPKDGETVWPVRGKLEVIGRYKDIRRLAARLARAPRLTAVVQLEVFRDTARPDDGRVVAKFELQRYVTRRNADPGNRVARRFEAPAGKERNGTEGL